MNRRWMKLAALFVTGSVYMLVPGCVEVLILNLAVPFLFNR